MAIPMTKHCIALAKTLEAQYTLRDRDLTHEEIFAEYGLLPALAKRAEQVSTLVMGYGLGASYEENPKSTLGTVVNFDDLTPDAIRMIYFAYVMKNIQAQATQASGKTVLDELLLD